MSFEEMMNSHKNPQPQQNVQNQNGMGLHHSVSSQQMNRGNLVVPTLINTHSHPHHNMVYNQQYPNQYGHHYAQSPQPHPNMQYQYGQHNQYQSTQGYQQKQGQAHWFWHDTFVLTILFIKIGGSFYFANNEHVFVYLFHELFLLTYFLQFFQKFIVWFSWKWRRNMWSIIQADFFPTIPKNKIRNLFFS